MKSSIAMLVFYQQWLKWALSGCDKPHPYFSKNKGLCASLTAWCIYDPYSHEMLCSEMQSEMHRQFIHYAMDVRYPFNDSMGDYVMEAIEYSCHLNERRIQWVKDRIKDGVI